MPTENLPFVSGSTNWNVTRSGDWNSDFNMGADYADMALKDAASSNRPYLISFIVKEMKDFDAIEMGFLSRISERAIKEFLSS